MIIKHPNFLIFNTSENRLDYTTNPKLLMESFLYKFVRLIQPIGIIHTKYKYMKRAMRIPLIKVHDYPGEFHMATEDKIIII